MFFEVSLVGSGIIFFGVEYDGNISPFRFDSFAEHKGRVADHDDRFRRFGVVSFENVVGDLLQLVEIVHQRDVQVHYIGCGGRIHGHPFLDRIDEADGPGGFRCLGIDDEEFARIGN